MRRFGNLFLRKKQECDSQLLEPSSPPVISPTSAAAAASAAMAELHIDRDLESPSSPSSPLSPGSRAYNPGGEGGKGGAPGPHLLPEDESTWPWASASCVPAPAQPGDILDSGCNSVTYAACPEPLRRAMLHSNGAAGGGSSGSGWCVRAFALLRPLGGGKLSAVWLAQCRRSCVVVALKLYPKKTLRRSSQRRQIAREIRLHSRLQDAAPATEAAAGTLLRLYAAFEDGDYIAIVLEHAVGGDLFVQMQSIGGRLSERCAARNVIMPTLAALHHMHSCGILHRDIKPENLMFVVAPPGGEQQGNGGGGPAMVAKKTSALPGIRPRSMSEAAVNPGMGMESVEIAMSESWFTNKKIRVADFGLAVDLAGGWPNSRVGTLDYMAPEVIMCGRSSSYLIRGSAPAGKQEHGEDDSSSSSPVSVIADGSANAEAEAKLAALQAKAQSQGYSVQVDAWAIGVLAYEILVGRPPFGGETREHKRANIVLTEPHFPGNCPGNCIEGCAVPNKAMRISGGGRISEQARDFIQRALRKDPDERLTITELMDHPWLRRFYQSSA